MSTKHVDGLLVHSIQGASGNSAEVNSDKELLVALDKQVYENALIQEVNIIGISSEVLLFPEGPQEFTIFHQHETAKLYFGGSAVSDSGYPYLEQNDTLTLNVNDSIELYAISDTADTEVFILGEVKE